MRRIPQIPRPCYWLARRKASVRGAEPIAKSETDCPPAHEAGDSLRTFLHTSDPSGYAAIVASFGCLPKARSVAIRFSVEGCVENNLRSAVPENGRMMYIWDIEGEASSGICFPTESSFLSARIIGSAVPSVRADVASALNSRVLEIAIRIKPAAIGARKIISKPPIGLRSLRPVSLRPPPNHIAIRAR